MSGIGIMPEPPPILNGPLVGEGGYQRNSSPMS
jgi:hypothetical protein